jgi:competence protein ComEA
VSAFVSWRLARVEPLPHSASARRDEPTILSKELPMYRLLLALLIALASQVAGAALNLNTATREELIAVSGIGPARAQAILDYRAQHGAFKSVDELKSVKGIGAKRLETLRSEFTVAPAQVKTAVRDSKGAPAAPKPDAKPRQ